VQVAPGEPAQDPAEQRPERAVLLQPEGDLGAAVDRAAGSSSVTRQWAVGSRGWETTASLPIRSGPSSSRRIERIEGVHSCHRSTSRITGTTIAGSALIRTTYSSCTTWYTVPSGT
jgi:hypothetical protein